jgi:hypothetical protein
MDNDPNQVVDQEENYEEIEKVEEEEEHQIVTLSGVNSTGFNKTLKYKGKLSHIPIFALIDTGATHSFINPSLVEALQIPRVPAYKLHVRGAWGTKWAQILFFRM